MPLSHDFKETVRARIETEPEFRVEVLKVSIDSFLEGDVEAGKIMLRDFINASIGFQELGSLTNKHPKSLMRMFGPKGNPYVRNFFDVIRCLQQHEGIHLEVDAAK